MENNSYPARKGRGKKILKKIITFFTCLVLVFVSVFLFSMNHAVYGYGYYNTLDNNLIPIGTATSCDIVSRTVNEEVAKLTNDGYYVVSKDLDIETMIKPMIVQTAKAKQEQIDIAQSIRDNLTIEVLLTQLNIQGDNNTYYFKTDEECNKFVDELNAISKVVTTSVGTTGKASLVTSQQVLQKLKAKYQAAAAARVATRKVATVTSRSGSSISRTVSYKLPIASYSYISSEYGMRWGRMHTGIDIAASYGTEIYAWKDGVVTIAGWTGGYGNFIEVQHADGTASRYGHCSRIAVSVGQQVLADQVIGYVGSTGNSTGNHLHFEVKVNGSLVNPFNYL